MADDNIATHTSADGSTHTTVIDRGRSSGGGGFLIALLVLVLAAVVVFYASGISNSEAAKDSAVAEAARDVGDAA